MLAPKKSIMLSLSMLMVSSVTGLLMSSVTGSLLCSASTVAWLPKTGARRKTATWLPSPEVELRGGDVASPTTTSTQEASEETLRDYLQDAANVRTFHVQGWRWHTMSVAREAERLQKFALRLEAQGRDITNDDLPRLQQAADYVVNFNLKALHRVEAMFFPWIRQRMNESPVADAGMKTALSHVMDDLQKDQRKLAALGESITHSLKSYSKSTTPPRQVARMVAVQSGQLMDLTKSMLEREITLVIPTIGLCVSEKEQKKFNNQVIKFLGVLESRTHLVHMHEVVAEADNALEHELWVESIPSLPRSLIPRWKRTLYEPRASMLNSP